MHLILANLMDPTHEYKHLFKLQYLTQLAGQPDGCALPTHGNFFFCTLLGMCKGNDEDPSKCPIRDINVRPLAAQILDDYARKIIPGVCTFMDVKRQRRGN